jgi:hypothetical protein
VGNRGFASKARVRAGTAVSIEVLAMGDSRGIGVTFSGNLQYESPGKLWKEEELRDGKVLRYQVADSLNNQNLALRSWARRGGGLFDSPQKVEVSRSGYKLYFDSGRILRVNVGGDLPNGGGEDISGGWVVGRDGFATAKRIPSGAVVSFRIESLGNALGVVVTYSGNQRVSTPGKLWAGTSLRQGMDYEYRLDKQLADQRLAFRSGKNPAGWDPPQRVQAAGNSHKLYFASGRVVEVTVSTAK